MHEAERGLFELRRRRALLVEGPASDGVEATSDALIASAEGLQEETLRFLASLGRGPVSLILTPHRARALGLSLLPATGGNGNGRKAGAGRNGKGAVELASPAVVAPAGRPLALELTGSERPEDVLRLCSTPGPMPVDTFRVRRATEAEAAGLALARMAHLLPAVVAVPVPGTPPEPLAAALAEGRILRARSEAVQTAVGAPRLAVTHVSEAPVPLRDAEDARFILFREENGLQEHVAILIGRREDWPDPVPVRLHSACLTGDLFGSLKCDCGEQLRGSLAHFQEQGGGVLLYLSQEGRGIGLGNKLRAYALQDGGLDTVDADCALGFGPDERSYDAALEMLRHIEIDRVQLLTNNPDKLRAVESGGVRVLDRMPLHGTLNRYNLPYVKAKVQRAGHWLGDMLSGVSGNGS